MQALKLTSNLSMLKACPPSIYVFHKMLFFPRNCTFPSTHQSAGRAHGGLKKVSPEEGKNINFLSYGIVYTAKGGDEAIPSSMNLLHASGKSSKKREYNNCHLSNILMVFSGIFPCFLIVNNGGKGGRWDRLKELLRDFSFISCSYTNTYTMLH